MYILRKCGHVRICTFLSCAYLAHSSTPVIGFKTCYVQIHTGTYFFISYQSRHLFSSYWTDNGACYYYYKGNFPNNEDTMVAVHEDAVNSDLPFAYLQVKLSPLEA